MNSRDIDERNFGGSNSEENIIGKGNDERSNTATINKKLG
jgi:hypothetical protein